MSLRCRDTSLSHRQCAMMVEILCGMLAFERHHLVVTNEVTNESYSLLSRARIKD